MSVAYQREPIRFPEESQPQLIVVIDTEEEFDWNADPDRKATGVTTMAKIDRVQTVFDEYGIKPCYVVDYPVVDHQEGYSLLKEYHKKGTCEIGAHLHPWVNPPFDEPLNKYNTYPGNLDRKIEKAKLTQLTEKIESVFGDRPTIYKAGRYGFGPNTASILEELGYEIDLSFCPPVDYRADGGPDYRKASTEPCWIGSRDQLLEIPITGGYVGLMGGCSGTVYSFAKRLERFRLPGIMSRLGVVDRLMLSPEGFSSDEHIKLTKTLFDRGVRTFTWSFHSPSVVPGFTPYVHNEEDLDQFIGSFRRFFDYFFNDLKGVPSTPTELKIQMEQFK